MGKRDLRILVKASWHLDGGPGIVSPQILQGGGRIVIDYLRHFADNESAITT